MPTQPVAELDQLLKSSPKALEAFMRVPHSLMGHSLGGSATSGQAPAADLVNQLNSPDSQQLAGWTGQASDATPPVLGFLGALPEAPTAGKDGSRPK